MLPDEVMSLWLECPLDDSLATAYCSDVFGDLVCPNVQLLRDSFTHKQATTPDDGHGCGAAGRRNADAAMALGVRRAAGLLSHPAAEAFDKVRTFMRPAVPKSAHSPATQALEVDPSSSFSSPRALDDAASPTQPAKAGSQIFPNPVYPVAQSKENLCSVAAPNKPFSSEGVMQKWGKTATEDIASQESSFVGSTTTVVSENVCCKHTHLQQKQKTESTQYVTDGGGGYLVSSPCQCRRTDAFTEKNMELDMYLYQSATNSTVTAVDKGAVTLGTAELTNLSPSRGSGNSTDKSRKEASMAFCKRKAFLGDESEQHKNFEASNGKKSSDHSNVSKRSRAAEIHNLSERRRRERINEKLRALQELIPNSNKTDKASMLDEAIEYLKLLQSQIQMMSMKTGIGIPAMMIPMSMHQLQAQPMLPAPHIGVRFGMEMGIPDVGIPTAGQNAVPMEVASQQALAVHTIDAARFQPSSSSLRNAKPQNYLHMHGLPTWGVMEPCMAALQGHQLFQN